jgi:hypothetical protein
MILIAMAAAFAAAAAPPAATAAEPPVTEALCAPADGAAYLARRNEARRLVLTDNNFAAAEPILEALVRDYPQEGHNWLLLGRARLRLGRAAEAATAYARAERMLGDGAPYRAGYWLAASQAAAGQRDAALGTLHRLVFERHYLRRSALWEDERFQSLRADPRFAVIAGHAADAATVGRVEGWRRDVDALREEVRRNVTLYPGQPLPAAFEREYARLRRAVPGATDAQIVVGMSRMLATLHKSHTNPWPFVPPRRFAFSQVPLQLYAFPEGLFVIRAGGHPELVGAQLIAIGDVPAAEAFARMTALLSHANPMEALWLGPAFLTVGQYLVGAGIVADAEQVPMTFRLGDGQSRRLTLAARPLDLNLKLVAPANIEAPLFLAHLDQAHFAEPLAGGATLYIQVNQIGPDQDESMADFGRRVGALLGGEGVRDAILDLRHNNGGDTFSYTELLRGLIAFSARPGCRLYVLIGRDTYSAAANLTTDLERLVAPVFVGEATAMTGNNDGDESEVVLPYSGLGFGITGARWQLSTPWDRRTSLVPDLPVQLRAADYFAGRDPGLAAVQALIAERAAGR